MTLKQFLFINAKIRNMPQLKPEDYRKMNKEQSWIFCNEKPTHSGWYDTKDSGDERNTLWYDIEQEKWFLNSKLNNKYKYHIAYWREAIAETQLKEPIEDVHNSDIVALIKQIQLRDKEIAALLSGFINQSEDQLKLWEEILSKVQFCSTSISTPDMARGLTNLYSIKRK